MNRQSRPPTTDVREAVTWALQRAEQVLVRDERDERPGTYYLFGPASADAYSAQVRPSDEYQLGHLDVAGPRST